MPCTLLHRPDQVSGALLASDLSSPTPRLLDSILTAPSRERCNSQRRRHPKTSTCRSPITTPPSPRSEASSLLELQVPDGTASASSDRKSRAPGAPLPAVSTFPCSSSMGSSASELPAPAAEEMSKYSSAVARDSTSALGFPPIDGLLADVFNRTSTLKFASVAATNALTVPPASSYVAPQVFGEMPTPRFCYENYCYEHPNPTQSSRVHGGSTNLVKQNLDGMPERYGLHNLNRHSLFRADGTEHSYFTLPTDYPLERVVLEPMFAVYDRESDGYSNEFIDVFAGISEQKQHEDTESSESLEELFSGQLPKYSSKASEIVIPYRQPPMSATPTDQTQFQAFKSMPNYDVYAKEDSACLNIISDVRDFTLGLQQQEDKRACNYSVLKAFDSLVTRSGHFNIEHSMTDLRLLWDPGASTFLVTPLNNDSKNDTIGNEHVGRLVNSIGDFSFHAKPPKGYGSADFSLHGIPPKVLKAEDSSAHTHFNLLSCNGKHFSVVQAIQGTCFSLEAIAPWQNEQQQQGDEKICVNVQQPRAPPLNVLVIHVRRKEWDPGDTKLHVLFTTAVRATKALCTGAYELLMVKILIVQFGARGASIFAPAIMCSFAFGLRWTERNTAAVLVLLVPCSQGKYVAKHPLEFILVAEILQNVSKFKDGNLTYMPHSPMANSSAFPRHMVTVWSCWLTSFGNSVRLQWEPGIAVEHQQGVHEYYNAKQLLLASLKYLPIWDTDIIFITFRPP